MSSQRSFLGKGGQASQRKCDLGSKGVCMLAGEQVGIETWRRWIFNFEDGGKGREQGIQEASRSWKRQGNGLFSRGPRRNTMIFSPVNHFRLLTSRNVREYICVALGHGVGITWWRGGKESACKAEMLVWSLGQEDPLRKKWQPTPVFLPGKSHGQRSLAGCSIWGCKESDTA